MIVRSAIVFSSLLFLFSCKTVNTSNVKATAEQKSDLRSCIIDTIKVSYSPSIDAKALNAFADELMSRAPSTSDTLNDYVFDEYVSSLDCDPKAKAASGTYGIAIVSEWAVSPFNPDNKNLDSK